MSLGKKVGLFSFGYIFQASCHCLGGRFALTRYDATRWFLSLLILERIVLKLVTWQEWRWFLRSALGEIYELSYDEFSKVWFYTLDLERLLKWKRKLALFKGSIFSKSGGDIMVIPRWKAEHLRIIQWWLRLLNVKVTGQILYKFWRFLIKVFYRNLYVLC